MASTQPKRETSVQGRKMKRKVWQMPTLEDVSAKIMAQPYIRFT